MRVSLPNDSVKSIVWLFDCFNYPYPFLIQYTSPTWPENQTRFFSTFSGVEDVRFSHIEFAVHVRRHVLYQSFGVEQKGESPRDSLGIKRLRLSRLDLSNRISLLDADKIPITWWMNAKGWCVCAWRENRKISSRYVLKALLGIR